MQGIRVLALAVALVWVAARVPGATHACAIDQRPSASANGLLARINRTTPYTTAAYAVWSYCYFPHPFAVGEEVQFTENRSEVARTLEASALRHPWGWVFGDGSTALGWSVQHTYTRPGHWRISVYADDPAIRRWTLFDQVEITVR